MKVVLTNFRCHSKKTVIIPENGLILIRGDNGKGKSTILKAIYYCLYGGGNKTYVKEGEKSMSVEIISDDISIKRSRPPNHLVYKDSEGEYEGDEAQSLVESFVGCNSLLFDVGCYIRQKHKFSSIITADSSDQSSVIEQISQKGNEIIIKERLKETIKHLEEQRKIYYTKKTLLDSSLSEKSANSTNRDPPEGFDPEGWTDNEINEEYERRRNAFFSELKKLDELRKKMLKASNDLSELAQFKVRLSAIASSLKKIKSTEEILEVVEDEIKKKEVLMVYLEKKDELKDLEEKRKKKIKELKKKLEDLESEETVEKELKELTIQLNLFTEMKRRQEKLELELESISTKLSSNKTLRADKNTPKKLSQLKKYFFDNYTTPSLSLICPCCDEEIYMSLEEEKLVKTIDKDQGTKKKKIAKFEYEKIRTLLASSEKISEELKTIKSNDISENIDELEKKIDEIGQVSRQIQITNAQIDHAKRPTFEEEKIKLYLAKTVIDKETEGNTIYEELLEEKKRVERELAEKIQLQKEMDILKKKMESFGDKEKILENLKEEIEKKEKKVEKLKREHSMFEDTVLHFKLWLLEKEKREKRSKDEKLLKEIKQKLLEIEKRLPILESLLVKSSKAAVICLQETLDTLNELAKSHLKELFEDEIEVTLSNAKEDKIKISIECSIRGVNITDFQEQLGGGEQQRIELAYCLALNELTGSKKVLMFDESFGALHPEIFMTCLRYLREKISLDRPILIVSHKEYEGIFDKVITL